MRTQTKILAALLMVSMIALTTTATLGYFIYERTLSGLVLSRFEFIATELKRKVEAGLDLGLPLGELENVNDLLRQEILTDDALVRLSIENARGIILFDTDTSRIGTKSSLPWLDSSAQGDPKSSDMLVRENQIGIPLVNSFGKVVGGLLVDYSKDYYDSKRAGTIRNVAEATLIVLLLSSVIGTCGVLAISRRLDYAVMRLEAGLRSILARLDLLPAAEITPDKELEAEIVTFERKVLDVVTALERAERIRRDPSLPPTSRITGNAVVQAAPTPPVRLSDLPSAHELLRRRLRIAAHLRVRP